MDEYVHKYVHIQVLLDRLNIHTDSPVFSPSLDCNKSKSEVALSKSSMFQESAGLPHGSRCNHRAGSHRHSHTFGEAEHRSSPFNRRMHSGREGSRALYGREGRGRDVNPFLQFQGGMGGGVRRLGDRVGVGGGPGSGLGGDLGGGYEGGLGGGLGGLGGLGTGGGGYERMAAMGAMMDPFAEREMYGHGVRLSSMMPPPENYQRGSPMMGQQQQQHRPFRPEIFADQGLYGMDGLSGMLGAEGMMSTHASRENLFRRGAGMRPLELRPSVSRPASVHSLGNGRGMELARMGMGRGPSNYRQPYAEDYESMIDPEELARRMQEMSMMEMVGGGPFDFPEMYQQNYMQGDGFGYIRRSY
jgi:hypothetical protein